MMALVKNQEKAFLSPLSNNFYLKFASNPKCRILWDYSWLSPISKPKQFAARVEYLININKHKHPLVTEDKVYAQIDTVIDIQRKLRSGKSSILILSCGWRFFYSFLPHYFALSYGWESFNVGLHRQWIVLWSLFFSIDSLSAMAMICDIYQTGEGERESMQKNTHRIVSKLTFCHPMIRFLLRLNSQKWICICLGATIFNGFISHVWHVK